MKNEQAQEYAIRLYDELSNERKLTPDKVMIKTGLDYEISHEICLIVWRMMRKEASRIAQDVLMTGI